MGKSDRFTATVWVPVVQIRTSDRRTRAINRATVEQYRQWLEQGREAPPVRLARHGAVYVVRDGRHRVAAALAAGHTVVEAVLQRIREMLGLLGRRPSISRRTLGMKGGRAGSNPAGRSYGCLARRGFNPPFRSGGQFVEG